MRCSADSIYVEPCKGSDRAQGTVQQPLKTIAAALKLAREWRRLGSPQVQGGIHIVLQEGHYRLQQPLFIRPEDSGTPASPTVIQAAPHAQVVIDGSLPVVNWHKGCSDPHLPKHLRSKIWTAEAPLIGNRLLETRQLWANGKRQLRAQLTPYGTMERMKAFDAGEESITIPTPAVDLHRAAQLEMIAMQRWAIAILRVKRQQDLGNGYTKLWFHQPESHLEFSHPWPQPVINGEAGSSAFTLANALELLDTPGEWYQDYPSGKLYYYPDSPAFDGSAAQVSAPVLSTLVQIAGTRERHVSNLRFEGIQFAHTAWLRPSHEGHVTLQAGFRLLDAYKLDKPGLFHKSSLENQAWIARPEAAVTAQFADSISFSHCRFEHMGSTAVDFVYAVNHSSISQCRFTDIGGTAVMAGYFGEVGFETHIPYKPRVASDLCTDIQITGCQIINTTQEDWGCAAINAGYVRNISITDNVVDGTNWSAICVGWGWTPLESGMQGNQIIGNTITHYAQQLHDAGGIYTLSHQPDSQISYNTVQNPGTAPYATNDRVFDIYFDEATNGFTVTHNTLQKEELGYNKPGPDMVIKDNEYTTRKAQ